MIVAYTVNHREIGQAVALAKWIKELGGVQNHEVMLCLTRPASRLGAEDQIKPILAAAFKKVTTFIPRDEVEIPWPNAENDARSPNHLFRRVGEQAFNHWKRPYLWMEMDAVPLKSIWLDAPEAEYNEAKKPFMGVRLEAGNISYMSGVGIYPANIPLITPLLWNCGKAPFDVFAGRHTVQNARLTKLIQYVKSNPNGPADWNVFKEEMNPDAVLYHRNKDLSLIDHLRGGSVKTLSVVGHGVAGDPQTGPYSPHVTPSDRTPCAEKTITETIREHCEALLEISKVNPGRRNMVVSELRRARLRK